MQGYSVSDVERLTGLKRGMVRAMIRQRFVAPARGPRRAYRFSFQDLIVLRAARALTGTPLSTRRIARSLRALRRHLPDDVPLSGLSLRAVGDSVSVREGHAEFDPGSGQYLLALDVLVRDGTLHIVEPRPAPPDGDADALFEQALASELADASRAIELYRRCLALEAGHSAARVNCARLLHESGAWEEAEQLYRGVAPGDPHAHFNLGVLLEDTGRFSAAIDEYLAAIAADPAFADAHYNLARLYELQGNAPHMIRHLSCYRSLVQPRSS